MKVVTPTCKICGWATSSTDVMVFGPEIMDHLRDCHPEAWAEFLQLTHDEADRRAKNIDWEDS